MIEYPRVLILNCYIFFFLFYYTSNFTASILLSWSSTTPRNAFELYARQCNVQQGLSQYAKATSSLCRPLPPSAALGPGPAVQASNHRGFLLPQGQTKKKTTKEVKSQIIRQNRSRTGRAGRGRVETAMAGAGAAGFPRELLVEELQCIADVGLWDALRRLKLDVLGTDDSPIPITGPLAPNLLSLAACS